MCVHLLLMTRYREEQAWMVNVEWETILLEMGSSGKCVGGGVKESSMNTVMKIKQE